jgi:hypothetical protein
MLLIISKEVIVFMSRSKKSRKPGGAPTAKPKLSKQELANVEKRIRKSTGNVAGNRQKEAIQDKGANQQTAKQKDPRLGNKTPIVLDRIKTQTQNKKQTTNKKSQVISDGVAHVHVIENNDQQLSAEQELELIEQDQVLQDILAKQEDAKMLTEQEVGYYNQKMERHQLLSTELGLYDESVEVTDDNEEPSSEAELWRKLDNTDLSDFTDKES